MILTNCAACAAPLAHNAPRCIRCKTRYCDSTCLGRPETDWARQLAMGVLGNGLTAANHHEEALSVGEAELAMKRRLGASEEILLVVRGNLTSTYQALGRLDDALRMEREIYDKEIALSGNCHPRTLVSAVCLANTLSKMRRFDEVRNFAPARIAECQRVLGAEHENTLFLRTIYARSLFASAFDPEQAETILVDVTRIARRVLGSRHPRTVLAEHELRFVRSPGEVRSSY